MARLEHEPADNIRILDDDARRVIERLPDASLGRVFILFPDPWRKARHHKRRVVSTPVLDALARAMKDGAELRLATDHVEYLRWMLALAPAHPAFEGLGRPPPGLRGGPGGRAQTRHQEKV